MALLAYQQQTQRLLNDPTQSEYNLVDINTYINIARGQIATSTQCLRANCALNTVATTQSYLLTAATIGGNTFPDATSGWQGIMNVRMAASAAGGSAAAFMELRPWEWFFSYYVAHPSPATGTPTIWSVQEQGPLGSIWFYPIPTGITAITLDAVGYPINLVNDTTVEAIPYPYTDAVPYFAAYLAYLNSQREQDAQQMLARWGEFSTWGVRQTTPTVMPSYFPGGRGAREAAGKIGNTGIGGQMPQQGRGGVPAGGMV